MGKLAIREESSTPSTPTEGVVVYPTVATPSILKLVDDAGTAYTFALLEKAQTFTKAQVIAPDSTGAHAVQADMPASTTGSAFLARYNASTALSLSTTASVRRMQIHAFDNGANDGTYVWLQRNSNGSTPAAGYIYAERRDGTGYSIWVDNTGVVRVLATSTPTNANDTAGTVIGTQTSFAKSKNISRKIDNFGAALQAVLDVPLYEFRYKEKFPGQSFVGIVTDHSSHITLDDGSPIFGMDIDEENPGGKSLNEISIAGHLIAAIKEQQKMIDELRVEIQELKAKWVH